jgi:hypothetical protein
MSGLFSLRFYVQDFFLVFSNLSFSLCIIRSIPYGHILFPTTLPLHPHGFCRLRICPFFGVSWQWLKQKLYWHAMNVTESDSFNNQGNLCMYIVTFVTLSRNYLCSGNATVHYARVVELHATVTCVKIMRVAQHCFHAKFMSPATVMYVVFMCSSKCRFETKACSFAHCLL